MIYIYRCISDLCRLYLPHRLLELVGHLLVLTKLCKGFDKLDLHTEYLIQLKVIK